MEITITTQYFTGFFAIVDNRPERRKATPVTVRLKRIDGEDE